MIVKSAFVKRLSEIDPTYAFALKGARAGAAIGAAVGGPTGAAIGAGIVRQKSHQMDGEMEPAVQMRYVGRCAAIGATTAAIPCGLALGFLALLFALNEGALGPQDGVPALNL